ncbi:MAG TPA: ABC transporter permease [Lacunisphaera sp.]|nr:ABC transporter permease [Lacunisphaera sp.]
MPLGENLFADLGYAWRSLRRNPGFAALVLLTLALGIGAATAMFSVVRAVWLQPLPFQEPDRLVVIKSTLRQEGLADSSSAYANIADWRQASQSFTGLVAYDGMQVLVRDGLAEAQQVEATMVDPGMWDVLGVQPVLGRRFTADEADHRAGVAVLSYDSWQSRFGGNPGIIGRRLVVDGRPVEVVGVMPRGFFFPIKRTELWVPMSLKSDWDRARVARGTDSWHVTGRLAPGVSLDRARAELAGIAANLERAHPDGNEGLGVRVVPLSLEFTGRPVRQGLLFLSGAVFALLLIACGNVASLLLVRGTVRQREFAVREAVGASRLRVVRQLLAEAGLMAVLASLLGGGLAELALRAVRAFGPGDIPRLDEAAVDLGALAFSTTLSLACVVLFSLLPALATTRATPLAMLRAGRGQSATAGSRRLRSAFVLVEFALAVALLVSSVVFFRSFQRLAEVDSGYHAPHVLLVGFIFPRERHADGVDRYVNEVLERVRALPGVTAAGFGEEILFGGVRPRDLGFDGAGAAGRNQVRLPVRFDSIAPDFFQAAGVALRAGRFFTRHDGPGSARVVIVNELLARRLWPGQDPIGRRLQVIESDGAADERWATVVGVVADLRRQGPDHEPVAQGFWPLAQRPESGGSFVIATAGDPAAMAASVRAAVAGVDRAVMVKMPNSLQNLQDSLLAGRKFNLGLMGFFAVAAVTLAGVGIFGMMSYAVTLRFPEFGVRLALGAEPQSIIRLVLGEGLRLAGCGIGLGAIGAGVALRGFSALLFNTSAVDPVAFAVGAIAVGGVALLACYLPARRVLRLNPVSALQAE